MGYLLVDLAGCDVGDKPSVEAFYARLEEAIEGKERNVAVRLHPAMKCGPELLDWLSNLGRIFAKAGKNLVAVPKSNEHRECLDLSHPDQNIRYVQSEDDLEALFPDDAPNVKTEKETQAGSVIEQVSAPKEEDAPPVVVRAGMVSDVSGEYRCLGCGAKRMWLKGDLVLTCMNQECLRPEAGWQLLFDVF